MLPVHSCCIVALRERVSYRIYDGENVLYLKLMGTEAKLQGNARHDTTNIVPTDFVRTLR